MTTVHASTPTAQPTIPIALQRTLLALAVEALTTLAKGELDDAMVLDAINRELELRGVRWQLTPRTVL